MLLKASPSDKISECGVSLRNKDVFNKAKWTGLNTADNTFEHKSVLNLDILKIK